MNIGIVLSNTPAYSETFFISKIKGLQKKGFNVTLFVNKKDKNFDLCEVKVSPNKKSILFFVDLFIVFFKSLSYFKRIRKFSNLEKKDGISKIQIIKKIILNNQIIFSNLDWLHFSFATQAIGRENLAKAIKAKMAVSIRGFDIAIYPLKHPNCYKLLWKNIDKLHTISDDLLQLAYNNGLNKKTNYVKITPAIDVNLFQREPSIKKNKNEAKKWNFLTVGRLHWKKGYIDTLKALKKVKDLGINFTYTIVGDGNEYERIAYMVYILGLSENVELKKSVKVSKVVKLMNKTDLYLQYSIQEGFCNAVLEAQAMELLCIVSNAEGLSENILDKKTGWVVEKNSPDKLATKIINVIELSEALKIKVKETAVKRVQEQFSLNKQQKEFVNFYKN
ncbi:MAG: glycosyltransferase family 4 protein [Flavobacteriaceae bacterium]|nr:glycosyltransferase family 4 protein [Flavobacteriaceae bacterium]